MGLLKISYTFLCAIFFFISFSTYSQEVDHQYPIHQNKIQSFYLIGDTGHAQPGTSSRALVALDKFLQNQPDTETGFVLFLGDNLPGKDQLPWSGKMPGIEKFSDRMFFISGEQEWQRNGIDGLKDIRSFLEEELDNKDMSVPAPGCAFSFVDISDDVHLIVLNSQWFLEDWNDHPLINDDCPEIKTREAMFVEIETELKKNQNKTTIFALHHPLRSNGPHGGKFSWSSYLDLKDRSIPVPVLGQALNLIRTSGGVSKQDALNPVYKNLVDRLETIAMKWGKVIFVSGHDHSLQYIEDEHLKQIVSGSGSKVSYARKDKDSRFVAEEEGFAVLDVFEDGSSWIRFFRNEKDFPVLLFSRKIFEKEKIYNMVELPEDLPRTEKASVYSKEETEKSELYKSLWGDRYRSLYEKEISLPVADLETLYGGLKPMRMGGGNQTISLRVKDTLNREYNFRMLRKDAVQFLQATAYKNKPIEEAFEDTFAEEMIQDFYTASHPFAFLAIPTLAEAAGVFHTNPEIFYMPKQPALGDYNAVHGNEIYMIEERPEENWLGHESFGAPNHDIQSTAGMFDRLRRDEKYKLDEKAYIRARIFDMLVGDWDRHNDQWRWAEIELENGDRIFRPIPRDRDQVFSNFDGSVFNNLRGVIGFINQFGKFGEDIADVKWFNRSAANLDRALLQDSGKEEWMEQVDVLQQEITDEVIAKAFTRLPEEIQGETTDEIIEKLKARRANLGNIVERYYRTLAKIAIMTGTDKDDYIDVSRLPDGDTHIKITRNKDGERADVVNERVVKKKETREVWVYGLDDDDKFNVTGIENGKTRLKLIGGQNNDIYHLKNGYRVKVYDHRTKPNTVKETNGARVYRTDNYEINLFDKNLKISNKNNLFPYAGFNPDNGLTLGFKSQYTVNNLVRKPFTAQHRFGGGYFFATQGFEASYEGEFAHPEYQYNLAVGLYFSSPKNTRNYFGMGNETANYTEEFSRDFNRVRISILGGEIGLIKRSRYGSIFKFHGILEGIRVEDTPDRFITEEFDQSAQIFDRIYYSGLEGKYAYESMDSFLNPSQGLKVQITAGGKSDVEDLSKAFLYLNPSLELYTPLSGNNRFVWNPRVQAQLNFLDDFKFYHAATLGGDNGLRAFRHERFTGSKAFSAGSDFRYSFNPIDNKFLPLRLGILGGYDLGRVWTEKEDSNVWHHSYGGGFWLTVAQAAAAEFNLFHGKEGFRFSFGFTFDL